MANPEDATGGRAPFHSLETYIGLPRVEGLALSPDGTRAVLTVATLSSDRTAYVRALWAVPTTGPAQPVRLTRSAKGESDVAFTPGGDVLFVSTRPDAEAPAGANHEEESAQVWRLPAGGGEARALTALAGGANEIAAVADEAEMIVVSAELLPSADSLEDDARRRAARRERKVTAILHESYPARFWDHELGPTEPHLLAIDFSGLADAIPDAAAAAARAAAGEADGKGNGEGDPPAPYPAELPRPRDLTPRPGRSADIAGAALTPDGRTLVASIQVPRARAGRAALAAIDTASGERRMLFDEDGVHFESPVMSHAGDRIAFQRAVDDTPERPAERQIWVAGVDGSHARRIAAGWDRWPGELRFSADDRALIATADQDGRRPVFRIPLDGAAVQQLTHDDHAYADIAVDRATGAIVALRSSPAVSPHPVRIAPDGSVTALATPAPAPEPPGRMQDIAITAADGARVRGWLVLPDGASPSAPAPLLLWIHGGPVDSWSDWSWRWSPMLAAARGYAVLLPDPGLSTGYGAEFVARGWNAWGQAPFEDLMAITDAVTAREDIDASATAAMGGSFGGYMANWIAGHTDRFRAIVAHASLWALEPFEGTTDDSDGWNRIFTVQGMRASSPDAAAAAVRTPMLVIHGDRDYRVPISEGLHLWSDLAAHHSAPDGTTPHRFLVFPDENHWVSGPQHAIVWYETVFAFLAQHVLGEPWSRPAHLG